MSTISLLDILDDITTESEEFLLESSEPSEIILESVSEARIDISEIATESYTVESAMVVMEMMGEATYKKGKVRFNVNIINSIRKGIEKFFKSVIEFFKNLFRKILTYFKNAKAMKQTKDFRKDADILKRVYEGMSSGKFNAEISDIRLKPDINYDDFLETMYEIESRVLELASLIDSSANTLEENSNIIQDIGLDKTSRTIKELISEFKSKIGETRKNEILNNSDLRTLIANKWFKDKSERDTPVDVRSVVPSYDLAMKFIDGERISSFQKLEKACTSSIKRVDARLDKLLDRLADSEHQNLIYQFIQSRYGGYREALTFMMNVTLIYWETYVIAREDVLSVLRFLITVQKKEDAENDKASQKDL